MADIFAFLNDHGIPFDRFLLATGHTAAVVILRMANGMDYVVAKMTGTVRGQIRLEKTMQTGTELPTSITAQ